MNEVSYERWWRNLRIEPKKPDQKRPSSEKMTKVFSFWNLTMVNFRQSSGDFRKIPNFTYYLYSETLRVGRNFQKGKNNNLKWISSKTAKYQRILKNAERLAAQLEKGTPMVFA